MREHTCTIGMHNNARSRDKRFMPALHESRGKKTLLVEKEIMGKTLNENWHISTILKRVCSVIQHHWARSFRWLSVASLVCNTSNETILNQLPESSSHGESCKCTRGQGGEEWPEETRLHSWWRHWCCDCIFHVTPTSHCTPFFHDSPNIKNACYFTILLGHWKEFPSIKLSHHHSRELVGGSNFECSKVVSPQCHCCYISELLLDTYSSCCICEGQVQVMSATLGQCNLQTLEQASNPSLNLAGGRLKNMPPCYCYGVVAQCMFFAA